MRLFKHRGDIYVSSVRPKINLEQKILVIILTVIVIVTAAFIVLLGVKYNFSIKSFFAPSNLTEDSNIAVTEELPEVSGKTNYLYIMMSGDEETVCLASIIQVDLDDYYYKVCTLSPNTDFRDTDIQNQHDVGGAAKVQRTVEKLFGITIDYYIEQTVVQYKNMVNAMGNVVYTVEDDISYKDISQYGFNLKIKKGEQSLDGDNLSKLIRYYVAEEKNYPAVNDIFLFSLSQQINETNYANRETLFATLISMSETNITIKDFTSALDEMKVISSENGGMNILNIPAEYNGNDIASSSKNSIKENFEK